VLKLGDLSFEADTDQQHADGARISDGTEGQRCLRAAASLLGLSPPALLTLLTTRTIETGQQNAQGGGAGSPRQRRGTTLAVQLNPAAAALARDAMARLIYGHLFGWVVATGNQSLAPSRSNNATTKSTPGLSPTKEEPDGEEEHEKTDSKNTSQNQKELVPANAERRTLGLLDMFGFEAFLENDLEQLLINLANEALQDMYCQQVMLLGTTTH
jgi:myosin heavy subunit